MILRLTLLISVSTGVLSCSSTQPTVDTLPDPAKNPDVAMQKTPPPRPDDEILSRNYFVAEKRLVAAVLDKDKETVALGLKSPILTIKIKTVDAISQFNDKSFVPKLIVALEENQSRIDGGSETKSFQSTLSNSIISTLEKLTKLHFDVSSPPTEGEIKEVIRKSKEWSKEQSAPIN